MEQSYSNRIIENKKYDPFLKIFIYKYNKNPRNTNLLIIKLIMSVKITFNIIKKRVHSKPGYKQKQLKARKIINYYSTYPAFSKSVTPEWGSCGYISCLERAESLLLNNIFV